MVFQNGDFRFFWPESIKDFITFPSAWDSSLNTGLGQPQLSSLWITSYFNFTSFFTKLGLDWNLIQIILWILPAFLLSFFSAFNLLNYFFNDRKYSIISGLIYILNTYFLMILTGGQLGVSLAYSLIPLVLLRFIKLFDSPGTKNSLLVGLFLSLQILFDPRIVYITLLAIIFYSILNLSKLRAIKNKLTLFLPFVIAVLLNSFWILPLILTKTSALPIGFDSTEGFKFFSFADFSHSLSLLHANWPENIFGKLYFLDPKFLVLPIIAFSSLLFVRTMKQFNNRTIVFFSILALLGVFLAKGANPPFGEINIWLFQNFPGMSMFRDPSKFYILIALSYSILIPFSLIQLSKFVKKNILFFAFILYFLILVSPILGQIKFREVPKDYVQLKNLFSAQENFSRTLWIPKWQRYGYFSNNHPAIGREELFSGNAKEQISKFDENLLRDLSVRYIIVPYDSESEIFLKYRSYNDKEYKDTIGRLRKISWLREVSGFDRIKVFELTGYKDHFWSPSKDLKIQYQFVSPTQYTVRVQNAREGDLLVFSEGFDKNWILKSSVSAVQSSYFETINSFALQEKGNYEAKISYTPQRYVEAGLFLSSISFIALLYTLRFGKSLKKW